MTDIRERIAAIICAELDRQHNADSVDAPCVYSKYGNLYGLDGEFDIAAIADVIAEELVDLAGTGQLLASIDRLYR